MTESFSNDNEGVAARPPHLEPDAHGQAALFLVESLMHGLIARSVIRVSDAVEIVGIAAEVSQDVGADLGNSPATLKKSISMLAAIGASFEIDLPRK